MRLVQLWMPQLGSTFCIRFWDAVGMHHACWELYLPPAW
jgi:hypothetical protein